MGMMPPRGPAPAAMPPSGGPAMGGADMPDLQQLWSELPPDYQAKLDPNDPITELHYTRLRDLPEELGQALISLMSKAEALELKAFKTAFPELELMLDIFDDGQINNSVGDVPGSGTSMGGAPMSRPAGPSSMPSYDDDEEEEDEDEPSGNRFSSIRA